MTSYEMVEKLSEKNNISLQQAKEALEQSNWDMLDAMIYLEKKAAAQAQAQAQPQAQTSNSGGYENGQANSNYQPQHEYAQAQAQTQPQQEAWHEPEDCVSFGELLGRLVGTLEKLINIGFNSNLVISKEGKQIASVPLLVTVILFLCFGYIAIPLFIFALFLGYSYSFSSSKSQKKSVKEKATGFADKMKSDFKKGMDETR